MIDAYEIGIQLALQDGVSAGLQVINRELAEVDRAIEATSAKLASLEHVAQVALGASAAGVKLPSGGGSAVGSGTHPEPEASSGGAPRPEKDARDLAPISSLPAAGPGEAVRDARSPAAPAATNDQPELRPSPAAPLPPLEREDAPAMVRPAQSESVAPVDVAIASQVDAAAPVGVVSAGASAAPIAADQGAGVGAPVASPQTIVSRIAAPERLTGDAPVQRERAVTARIAHTVINRGAEAAPDRVPTTQDRTIGPATSVGAKAAAPWSGVETRVISPRATGATEPAAAPAARPSDRAQGMSGNIMLDGHLVGYWLSEQMAREASRPPSGTSFFDPRQSPAWTASGSL